MLIQNALEGVLDHWIFSLVHNFIKNTVYRTMLLKYSANFIIHIVIQRLYLFFDLLPIMMTLSNGNIFHVTGPLCGEYTNHRWIPLTKANDAELWCFLWSVPWINGWVNNCEAGDLRRRHTHYDVIVMIANFNAIQGPFLYWTIGVVFFKWTEQLFGWSVIVIFFHSPQGFRFYFALTIRDLIGLIHAS